MTNQNDWNNPSNLQSETVPTAGALNTITKGMDVYDSMDQKVGSIAEVWANVSATAGTFGGGTTGTGTGYFKVDQGGVMGIGATELYIPFSAVMSVNAGDNRVMLNCTQQDADNMYQTKPAGLDTSS